MLFLRLLSFIAGTVVLMAAPFLLLSGRQAAAPPGAWSLALGAAGVALFAAAYFFFAFLARRMSRSAGLRQAGAALTACQMLLGAALLTSAGHSHAPLAAAPLLCFSAGLFMAFVWPGKLGRNHRPLRPRESQDSHLSG